MAKHTQNPGSKAAAADAPHEFPQVPPTSYDQHSFVLQAIMENQKTLGKLEGSIESLHTLVADQGKKISTHGYLIAVATGALLVICTIGAFTITHAWPQIQALMTMNVKKH